jgi:hypothetical protein
MPDVTLLYNKSNPFGLAKDVEMIRRALGGAGYTLRGSDPLEPPVLTDIAIHLEVPVYGWMPWAKQNILVVNPEWFKEAWRPYMSHFDAVIYKDSVAAAAAVEAGIVTQAQAHVVPWGCEEPIIPATKGKAPVGTANTGFVWFLGGSVSKRAAVAPFVAQWREEYPPLRIYTVEDLDLSGTVLPSNVKVEVRELNEETRGGLGRFFRGHVCCSTGEGFGYTAAEAEWHGAFTILNDLPVYRQDYQDCSGVTILPELSASLDGVMAAFEQTDFDALAATRRIRAKLRLDTFLSGFKGVVDSVAKRKSVRPKRVPPVLEPSECPRISVVTLLYNRRKFFDLACHSMIVQDYPKDKIEWIIVEDSDDPMEDASDRVMAVAEAAAPLKVVYVPLKKKTPIGRKRNIGVEKATADIVLMMDDDDHYPETSFRRRVSWLTRYPWTQKAVAATTIACYDLVKGVSAVNVPPFEIPLAQRISEATLTFQKSWWEEKKFPDDVQIGEGEGILVGREGDLLEIPPQQVIVAFSHGRNASSRRIPGGDDLKPGCFWGFPREFLVFIHELAGVKVVDEEGGGAKK